MQNTDWKYIHNIDWIQIENTPRTQKMHIEHRHIENRLKSAYSDVITALL